LFAARPAEIVTPAAGHVFTGFETRRYPLYGIEAITASNGWSMALAGVIIVFSGLVVLSFTISQFHKVLNFLEGRVSQPRPQGDEAAAGADPSPPSHLTESARQYKLISERIGEPFALPKLLELAELSALPHPHSTVNELIKAGLIIPDGKGYFLWKV
jgi:hypothetical protein